MEIVKIPIDELTMYKKNAKMHPREQIEQIKQSIKMYGNNDPIGVWGDQNQIVEGHGRYIAMKELGFTECECIRLDHLSDKERREYMLVHNQTTMNSGWDMDILSKELDGMDFEGFDFGFDNMQDDFDETGLDAEESGDERISCKFTFDSYNDYAAHEIELKEIAERIGALFSVNKQ